MDRNRYRYSRRDDWFDWWLSDEPPGLEARQKIRQKRVERANTYRPREMVGAPVVNAPTPTNITINLQFPKIKIPAARLAKLRSSIPVLPYRRIVVSCTLICLIGLAGLFGYRHFRSPSHSQSPNQTASHIIRSSPSFQPIVPKDKPELATLGNSKTAYDGSKDVFSYIDTFQNFQLTISQQPLPTSFGTAQAAIDRVAASIGARETIGYNSGTAYAKTDNKANSQSLVLSLNGLLIFIQSPFRHSAFDWTYYINSLQ
ncbi:MAG: hypothetical protein JWO96_37 [Candidatus Saccharibacteria bacterium]|nr:hypothetical protein [Candidatus Saccharibacteria bacterium]